MKWCTAMRGIRCLWSVSKPLSGTYWSWGEPYKALSSRSLVSPCYSPPMLTLKLHTKWQVDITFHYGKWDFLPWRETSIAYEVFQVAPWIHKEDMRCYWKYLQATHGSHHAILLRSNLKLYTKYQIFLPYWYSKWDYVLQIKTYIACEVFQNLP